MEIPEEIIDQILGLGVVNSNIVYFWSSHPKIKKYVVNNKSLNWTEICKYQKLPECFIREFMYQVDWEMITHYQFLSEDFKKYYQAPEGYTWKYVGNVLEINWDHPYL